MTVNDIGTVERAFELAKSGECDSVADIRRRLMQEHRSNIDAHLTGGSIRRQLMQEIAIGREPRT